MLFRASSNVRWVKKDQIQNEAVSTGIKKILAMMSSDKSSKKVRLKWGYILLEILDDVEHSV